VTDLCDYPIDGLPSETRTMNEPRTASPSMSTIGRVADLDVPQPRQHPDTETLNRAVERFWSARWAAVRRRGSTAVISALLGSGATASGFVFTTDEPATERPAVACTPVACEPDPENRREARLILDYLAAIVVALRNAGVQVVEPRPAQLPNTTTTNGRP
jgi:hypothetical protein